MTPLSRLEILKDLRQKIDAGQPIIGGGAGTGISAQCEEAGGIDLIVIYNSGRYRMAGRGSLAGLLPYGNRSEERRVGKECVSTCRSRWSPARSKKNNVNKELTC